MQKPNDELLIAYLDGELDAETATEVAGAIARDPALAREAEALAETAAALRVAFDDVLQEPVPERLLAAAHGELGDGELADKVVRFPEARKPSASPAAGSWRRWASLPIAASVACLIVGGGVGYFLATQSSGGLVPQPTAEQTAAASLNWLDNVAGYHKMLVNAGPNDTALVDIPADPQSSGGHKLALPQDFHLPDLKPWGLAYQGGRVLFIEGRPATQLFYTTDNKALGPVTVVVATTTLADKAPTPEQRGDVNMLWWRHHGHEYAVVGTANLGYLWNIHNDLAWQLDAI
jgi:anti-sigma factor RsiW